MEGGREKGEGGEMGRGVGYIFLFRIGLIRNDFKVVFC